MPTTTLKPTEKRILAAMARYKGAEMTLDDIRGAVSVISESSVFRYVEELHQKGVLLRVSGRDRFSHRYKLDP